MVDAEFVVSAVSKQDFPREIIPEVVFAGRSNVGKSSLINRLARKEKLARISTTPGKTRSINFYRINRSFFFVDLPGYGFAKAAKSEIRQWKKLIEQYFVQRPQIALVIQLVDSRLPPTKLDLQLSEWLDKLGIPRMVVATKSDKLSHSQCLSQRQLFSATFGGQPVIMSSAKTGMGCKDVWKRVLEAISASRSSNH